MTPCQKNVTELEQGRHDLRLKLEGCQSGWVSQVGDLERDMRDLSGQVARLTQALTDAERDKTRAQEEDTEHTQRLREQLSTAMEVERAMTSQLQTLKLELRQRGHHNRPQDEELLSAMSEQVVRLSQREQALEERLESVCQENADLRDRLASLHTRSALQDQHNQQQSQQLTEAWQEAAAARGRSQQLQVQVEELQEEVSLQYRSSHGNTSLLSELETSLDTMGLGHDREQLQEENAELRLRLGNRQDEEELAQQAIRDRDEAIAKKNLMEAELVRSKNDMMCLNNQLLEAIQRKLELSQELEAWQDDIQIIINQQLRTQQQLEQVEKKPASNPMSFWRRPSTASSTRPRRPSSSPASWTSEAGQEKPQSPWRDWLRRGKVTQPGK
ncbi:BICD family-like cargo adapter 1 isoform X2 [Salvelinus namaycush]|uniref:BICD family-like cargo adapter 1 isoform X2 n=1 Tax=Salvelinus namaycush TaxID=8040 RepID=A0A8U0PT00_SALNM|nr:BICD family-like cargo adapter 1 isoform X2 [Salvelinus namaycush]